jgi:hypothetical protein
MSQEVVLTTNQMAFFIYNLIGHDISHDGHPSGLGEGRFSKAIISTKNPVARGFMSTSHGGMLKGGSSTLDLETAYFSSIRGMDSRNSLISSIGFELIGKKMLYVTSNIPRNANITDENRWQNLSIIIIDIQTIIRQFNRGNYYEMNSMYPGFVYFNDEVISPYDIVVNKTSSGTGGLGAMYTVSIPSNNIQITFYESSPQNITIGFATTPPTLIGYLQADGTNFKSIIDHLGEEFVYTSFSDYMKNTSLLDIEGLGYYFQEYILKKTGPDQTYFFQQSIAFYNAFTTAVSSKTDANIALLKQSIEVFIDAFIHFFTHYNGIFNSFARAVVRIDLETLASIFIGQIEQLSVDETIKDNIYSSIDILSSGVLDELISTNISKPEKNIFLDFFVISKLSTNNVVDEDDDEDEDYEEDMDGGKITKRSKSMKGGAKLPYLTPVIPNNFLISLKGQFIDEQIPQILDPSHSAQVSAAIVTNIGNSAVIAELLPRDSLPEVYAQELYGSTVSSTFNTRNLLNFLITASIPSEEDISNLSETAKFKNYLYNNPTDTTVIGIFIGDLLKLFDTETSAIPDKDAILSLLILFNGPEFNGKLLPIFVNNVSGVSQIKDNKSLKRLLDKLSVFEQNIIRQIRIGLLYLLMPEQFADITQIKVTKFIKNMLVALNVYLKLIAKVTELFEASPGLTTIQKINSAYMIATAVLSISESMKKIIDPSNTNSSILDAQIKILSSIYLKKNVSSGKTGIGNIDDKLFEEFKKWLKSGPKGAGNFIGNAKYLDDQFKGKTGFMDVLAATGFGPILPDNNLYYINNAVTAKVGLPDFFCPFSSIMDGQSHCNTLASSLKNNGVEFGAMDVIIRNGNIIGQGIPTTGETMRYHIRVEQEREGSTIVLISVFLKIGNEILINIGRLSSTPSSPPADPPIRVDLNSRSSPLEASECLKEIIDVNLGTIINASGQIIPWDTYLQTIQADPSLRRKIITSSFRKSLGDFLQELNSVIRNGGYISAPAYKNIAGKTIVPPEILRLGLANDRPSGIRMILLILFGQTGINDKCAGGFINNDGKYLIAIRTIARRGGNISKKNKKTVKNKIILKNKKNKNVTKYRKSKSRYTRHKK